MTQEDDRERKREAVAPQNRQHPTCLHHVQDICNTSSFLWRVPHWFTILHRPAVCAKRNFIWQVGHYALYGRKQSVFCLGSFFFSFFAASGPPFLPARERRRGEYMILVRWSGLMLNSSHKLGLKGNWSQSLIYCGWFLWHALWHQHPLCSIDLWWYEYYLSVKPFWRIPYLCG